MLTDGSVLTRRRVVLLANLILCGFLFRPHRLPPQGRLVLAGAWLLCRGALLQGIIFPNSTLLGPVVRGFRPQGREIWLTLDDGPNPASTPGLLDLLGEYNARATFFVIGQRTDAHPALVRAMFEGGHQIGNHTHTHPSASFWAAFPGRSRREVQMASAAIERAAGVVPRYFRAPAGLTSPLLHRVLAEEELLRVGWNARGFDGIAGLAERSVERTMRAVRPGAIVLFHGEGRTAASGPARLRRLLRKLTADGYRCVVPEEAAPGG